MMSKHYKFSVTTIIVLAIITILSNYILIPKYGINGAAYAALISSVVFNLTKIIFIYLKFNFLPFSKNTFFTLIIGLITYLIIDYVPTIDNIIIEIIFKSLITIILFITPIYFFNLSSEFNKVIEKFISHKNSKF